jgi:hypothetical protein
LVLELGLDSKKLSEGMRAVMSELRHDSAEIIAASAAIEGHSKRVFDAFNDIKRAAIGVTAFFLGGRGITEFISHLTALEFHTGMVAKQMGIGAEKLSVWQGVMRQMGGTAEGLTHTFQSLQDVAVQAQFGNISSQTAGIFNILGANPRELDPAKQFEDLARGGERLMHMGWNPAFVRQLFVMLGYDQDAINLAMTSQKQREEMIRQQEKMWRITEADAEAAKKFWIALGQLDQAVFGTGKTATQVFFPAMTAIVDKFKEFLVEAPLVTVAVSALGAAMSAAFAFPAARWLFGGGLAGLIARFAGPLGLGALAGTGLVELMKKEAPSNPERQMLEQNFPWLAKQLWGGGAHGLMDPRARRGLARQQRTYLRSHAAAMGIDPDAAEAMVESEGGFGRFRIGDGGTSFGPGQLHTSGDPRHPAAGDVAMSRGIDIRNPSAWKEQFDFILQWVKQHGWGDFHGMRNRYGADPWAGIHPGVPVPPGIRHHTSTGGGTSSRTTSIEIGSINMPNVRDAPGFVKQLPAEVRRASAVASVAESSLA